MPLPLILLRSAPAPPAFAAASGIVIGAPLPTAVVIATLFGGRTLRWRILVPTDVVGEGEQPAGRVIFASGIGEERVNTVAVLPLAGVLPKRSTDGCVDGTGVIAVKRISADCRVEGAGNTFDRRRWRRCCCKALASTAVLLIP